MNKHDKQVWVSMKACSKQERYPRKQITQEEVISLS